MWNVGQVARGILHVEVVSALFPMSSRNTYIMSKKRAVLIVGVNIEWKNYFFRAGLRALDVSVGGGSESKKKYAALLNTV